jgi:hypothetical protein
MTMSNYDEENDDENDGQAYKRLNITLRHITMSHRQIETTGASETNEAPC